MAGLACPNTVLRNCTSIASLNNLSVPFRQSLHVITKQKRKTMAMCSQVPGPAQNADYLFIEDDEVNPDLKPSLPATRGRVNIVIDTDTIKRLDLSPAHAVLRDYVYQIGDNTSAPKQDPRELLQRTVGFTISYEREDPNDMRELSEIPEVRLWFICLDGSYPWLPVVLDWRAGELGRYAAMLVPHQMSRRDGLVFNPEGLELFAMGKLFTIYNWLEARKVPRPESKVNDMLQMLGFKVDEELFELLRRS